MCLATFIISLSTIAFSDQQSEIQRNPRALDRQGCDVSGLLLLIVEDHLRRRFAPLDLRAHLLKARSKSFYLLLLERNLRCEFILLLRDGRFLLLQPAVLLLDLAVLFQELVEQHRVHCFVAYSVYLAICIAHHQVGVHLLYLLRDQAELRDAIGIDLFFIMEGDWL